MARNKKVKKEKKLFPRKIHTPAIDKIVEDTKPIISGTSCSDFTLY